MEALVLFAEELLARLSKHFHGRVRKTMCADRQTDRQTDYVIVIAFVVGYLCKGREMCCTENLLSFSSGTKVSGFILKYTPTERVF